MHRNSESLNDFYQILYRTYGPQKWWPASSKFEMMVGAVLTQNTAWKNVEKAIKNLKQAGALKLGRMINMSLKKIARLVKPAGYFNIKARRLRALASWLQNQCRGDINRYSKKKLDWIRKELLKVYGIGPETADSILLYAMNKKSFVVDAYTKRIFSRHGFFKEGAKYDEVKSIFEKSIPRNIKIYNEFHALIVRLAKEFCKKKPECLECPLRNDLKILRNGLPISVIGNELQEQYA